LGTWPEIAGKCKGNWSTRLQENPQLILQLVVMIQFTSRRILRELDEVLGGNNLQYILKCPCIPFFGNQGLHNEIMLGGNGRHSRVMCEGSPYIYSPSKVAASQSNGSGIENGVKVGLVDVSWDGWVLPIVLCNEVQCLDIGGYLPRVVFSAKTLPLDQKLEPPPVPATI